MREGVARPLASGVSSRSICAIEARNTRNSGHVVLLRFVSVSNVGRVGLIGGVIDPLGGGEPCDAHVNPMGGRVGELPTLPPIGPSCT